MIGGGERERASFQLLVYFLSGCIAGAELGCQELGAASVPRGSGTQGHESSSVASRYISREDVVETQWPGLKQAL